MPPPLILASGSPRRLALLEQVAIVPAGVVPAEIDESPNKGELPRHLACRLAAAKAGHVAADHPEAAVLGADTVVACGRRILPKAEDADQAGLGVGRAAHDLDGRLAGFDLDLAHTQAVGIGMLLGFDDARDRERAERVRRVFDAFDFEEIEGPHDPTALVWGNGAWACLALLAQAYRNSGWSMTPGEVVDLEDLPAYTYRDDGDTVFQPCAEVNLSDTAAEELAKRGLMPLVSHANRNAVRLARFQSIADPSRPLAGPW